MGSKKLNDDFKATCRLLFGQEIGELREFAPYLSEMIFPFTEAKSCVSGKSVMLSGPHYPKNGKFIAQREEASLNFSPLGINQIKDIDSLLQAASERAVYCGNKEFGSNLNVSQGDNCADCIEAQGSHDVYRSKYVGHCSVGRFAESIYGVNAFWKANHSMRCMHCFFLGANRCFETYYASGISDSYYTYNCSGCSNCIFCFNLRAKSNCIGNLQLSRERYTQLKAKLTAEMAEKLRKDKRLFSIADIVKENAQEHLEEIPPDARISPTVEKDFASTCHLLLGREHSLPRTGSWLLSRAIARKKIRGKFGTPTYVVQSPIGSRLPQSRLATLEETLANNHDSIRLSEAETPALDEMASRAGKIALFTQEFQDGTVDDVYETVTKVNSSHTHGLWWAMGSKHSAFSSIVTESEHIFGGYVRVLNSQFCINCDNVTKCSNCFECDSCYSCLGCYFCHNCENVENGLFCFNLKGARYAVLNQPVSKEEYLRVKKILLDYVNLELEAKAGLDFGIFSIGAAAKKPENQ